MLAQLVLFHFFTPEPRYGQILIHLSQEVIPATHFIFEVVFIFGLILIFRIVIISELVFISNSF